jgi:hypothetical protein
VDAVDVTDLARNAKPLITGGIMVLAAMAVVWATAALQWGGMMPWLIAGVLVVLSAVTASAYIVAEETAMITFRTRTTEVPLALRTPLALRDSYLLANAFFEAKAGHVPSISAEVDPLPVLNPSATEGLLDPDQSPGAEERQGDAMNPFASEDSPDHKRSPEGEGRQDV